MMSMCVPVCVRVLLTHECIAVYYVQCVLLHLFV